MKETFFFLSLEHRRTHTFELLSFSNSKVKQTYMLICQIQMLNTFVLHNSNIHVEMLNFLSLSFKMIYIR